MKRSLVAALATALVAASLSPVRADDPDVAAVLDRAIRALGGEAKLARAETVTWKATEKNTGGDVIARLTMQGPDRYRNETEREIHGRRFKFITVVNGGKSWRKSGDKFKEVPKDMLNLVADGKQAAYFQAVTMMILPLKKDSRFNVESIGERSVGDRPATALKVTGPDGERFKIFFDKQSGLPVKTVRAVRGRRSTFSVEVTYTGYKGFDGINRATKVRESIDALPPDEIELSDFKILDKVPPETFAEP